MNIANNFEAWTNRLEQRPEIFPHSLNLITDQLLLVELSAAEVSAASFLDQRVLKQTAKATWIPWQVVADIMGKVPGGKPAGFIFHVGHCGSTLLSRLLEFAPATKSLREPLPLRVIAQDLADAVDGRSFLTRKSRLARLGVLSKMWCRGADHTVIKATSVCTDLLPEFCKLAPATRSVFIYNLPQTHIATLLAGQNAMTDLKGFAQLRLQRVRHLTGLDIRLNQLSPGKLAALGWLSETTSVARSLQEYAGQVDLLEFESFLAHQADTLERVMKHLEIPADKDTVESALRSPVLQTYSKAPEHKYNAQTRAAILADARSRFRRDIGDALTWLDDLAGRSDIIAESLKVFGK